MRVCGYCKESLDERGECGCNGFGGPRGLSRIEGEARCGYCQGPLYMAVPNPDRPGYFMAIPIPCGCNGFGKLLQQKPLYQGAEELLRQLGVKYELDGEFVTCEEVDLIQKAAGYTFKLEPAGQFLSVGDGMGKLHAYRVGNGKLRCWTGR